MRRSEIQIIKEGSIKSYAQVFFSDNLTFGWLLLLVSFFDFYAGLYGLAAVLLTNVTAYLMGYDTYKIRQGTYGYNSLLVGLGIGLSFMAGWQSAIIVFIAAILTFIFTIVFEAWLGKYTLPFLSIPFLLVMWIVILSGRELTALGLSERGIYTINEIYGIGGKYLVNIYQWFEQIEKPLFLKTYFLSLGAIFFQYNILAGVLISLGLLYHSRIAFSLSLLGFGTAFVFYQLLGIDITQYGYSYIGFNYILTAIAIGGFFLIPNKYSFLWVIILLPVVVLISLSAGEILKIYQLPVYSLPFNIVVLSFLYFIKLRQRYDRIPLQEVIVQFNSPEKNLYYYQQASKRFKWLSYFPMYLPFLGKWTVSQAENGAYTHQGDWKYAWDFIMNDYQNKQFKNTGDFLIDYYCFDKNIVAPSDGTVVSVVNNIDDNTIGDVNLLQNWGNSVVIKHTEYLYSQVSHLKKGSIVVKKGTVVKKGDLLAHCGNSGRSPYPHLHFQLQATPYIGSPTISYPISHYIRHAHHKFELHSYDKPVLNDVVSNMETTELLIKAFKFIPGQKLQYEFNGKKVNWEVKTDYYNNTYIYCAETQSYAYLYNDGQVHYFKSFSGDKKSGLYYFYLALYQIPLGYYQDMIINDQFPPNVIIDKHKMFLQDFIAPFWLPYQADYQMKFVAVDDELYPGKIEIKAQLDLLRWQKVYRQLNFEIHINEQGISQITSEAIRLILQPEPVKQLKNELFA